MPDSAGLERRTGGRGGIVEARLIELDLVKTPRPCDFAAKIMLGFAVVLAISAASMGIAYLGFERVSDGVDGLPEQRVGGRSGARTSIAS